MLTIMALPPRLWTPQLKRLGLLALIIFVTTAIFAGEHKFKLFTNAMSLQSLPDFSLMCCCVVSAKGILSQPSP